MTYQLTLFFHLVGVFLLFGAITVENLTGKRLRSATTVQDARATSRTFALAVKLFPISSIIILLSGGYLAHLNWGFHAPFVVLGLALLIIVGAAAPALHGRRLRALGAELEKAPDGPITSTLAQAACSAGIWIPSYASTGIAAAIAYLMVMKPGWTDGIVVAVAVPVVMGIIGASVAKRASAGVAAAPTTR